MKGSTAYVLRSGRRLAPFGRLIDRVRVQGLMVGDHRRRALHRLGMREQLIDDVSEARPPCVLLSDDLYLTPTALAAFVETVRAKAAADSGKVVLKAALECSPVTERFLPELHETEPVSVAGKPHRCYPLYFLPGAAVNADELEAAQPVTVAYRQTSIWRVANPYFEASGRFEIPLSLTFMLPIRHWAQVLAANLQGMPSHLLQVAMERKLALASMPLVLPWRSGSLRPARMRGHTYLKGAGCRIDPSAHVEMSVLGDKVRIGPNAVVRNCVTDKQADIGPGAVVEGSSLGPRATVNSNVTVRCCSAERQVSLGAEFVQWSVFGQGSVMCPLAGFYDLSVKDSVEVELDGQSVPTGNRILGGCLGERAFVGPAVGIAAGKAIPNGWMLINDPRLAVRRPDRKLPGNVWRVDDRI